MESEGGNYILVNLDIKTLKEKFTFSIDFTRGVMVQAHFNLFIEAEKVCAKETHIPHSENLSLSLYSEIQWK